ncbi:MAG: DUF432 domain-containing protein [Thermoplasmata archaeon]|nr:DUF432 domain-containing protein [Thermoplasmata archaeon]
MAKGFYGTYRLPFALEIPGLKLSLAPEGDGFLYRRVQGDECVEKLIFPGERATVKLLPVEPVNLPGGLAQQLHISFKKPLLLPPRGNALVCLVFPVEVGVFVKAGTLYKVVDIFTLARQKLTFVGDFEKGRVSKYYESDLHTEIPPVSPLKEGVLRLRLRNRSGEWQNVERVSIPAEDIKIFYGPNLVSMTAEGVMMKGEIVKLEVKETPLKRGMKPSAELYRPGAFKKMTKKLLVEVE